MNSYSLSYTVTDPLNRTVTLETDAEKHITERHSEIKPGPLMFTVATPQHIWQSGTDPQSDVYFRCGADPEYPQLYYKVVVRFDSPTRGTVTTAFLTKEIEGVGRFRYVNIHS